MRKFSRNRSKNVVFKGIFEAFMCFYKFHSNFRQFLEISKNYKRLLHKKIKIFFNFFISLKFSFHYSEVRHQSPFMYCVICYCYTYIQSRSMYSRNLKEHNFNITQKKKNFHFGKTNIIFFSFCSL